MSITEARELVASPIWAKVRDAFLASGTFEVYPAGDLRRLAYVDEETRARIDEWKTAIAEAPAWKTVVDGAKVREIKARFPHAYPEVFRYLAYFKPSLSEEERTKLLLKLKFPEACKTCFC